MRIALIHALKHSIAPIEAAFAKAWPEARLMNLLDDSLSADLARDGVLNDAMTERFLALGDYAADRGERHPVHLFGLRPLHRGSRTRARAHAGAETE